METTKKIIFALLAIGVILNVGMFIPNDWLWSLSCMADGAILAWLFKD